MRSFNKTKLLAAIVISLTVTGCASAQPEISEPRVSETTAQPTEAAPPMATVAPTAATDVEPQAIEILAEPMAETQFLMGTTCTIRLYHNANDEVMQKAFDRIRELELVLSANEGGTEIDEINLNAGVAPVRVGNDTMTVVKRGLEYSEMSDGGFDITIGPLTGMWLIGFDGARIPAQDEIDAALPMLGYKDVVVDEAAQTVFLKREGMKLDLGAIAKGYTADEVARVLRENGVGAAIIDLGGNIYVVGQKGDRPWSVGVQDPVKSRGQVLGIVPLADKSIVTSGIYERYLKDGHGEALLDKNGKRYHHLLDPATGYPFDNELVSVTIFSDYSIDGDGLSTVVFAKGLQEGLAFVETLPSIEAAFVTYDDKVYITSGLQGEFSLYTELYTMGN